MPPFSYPREINGLSQEELALKCDLTKGYINFLENGKRGYAQKSLAKIAKALGVPISQLFEEEKRKAVSHVAEPSTAYSKRGRLYNETIALLDKLPDAVVKYYKTILSAEVAIKSKGEQ